MTDEIASLRASVERLTAERDEAVKLVPALREALGTAHARAESAEATIARLGAVVRAASKWRNAAPCSTAFHREGHSCEECEALGEEGDALSSLTPEDRRRAGIEG